MCLASVVACAADTGAKAKGDDSSESESEDSKSNETGDTDDNSPVGEGPDIDAGLDGDELNYITVTPKERMVAINLNESTELIQYKAIGHYGDGSTEDITQKVKWVSNDKKVGTFDKSSFSVKAHSALYVDSTTVSAKLEGKEGKAQITVAAYNKTGANPDFLFVLPFKDKDGEKNSNLAFKTNVQSLDVFFGVDTTSSMKGEIAQLRSSLSSTISKVRDEIKDTQFGVGSIQDFPIRKHGSDGSILKHVDQPFELKQAITDKASAVQKGVDSLKLGLGLDQPEAIVEALYQIATGDGLNGPGKTKVLKNKKGVGGVEFRKGTMPVVVTITDAATHAPGENHDSCKRDYKPEVAAVAATRKKTEEALEKICARVIYVASEGGSTGECDPAVDGVAFAKATKARVTPAVWGKNRPANCGETQCCTGKNGQGLAPEDDGLCSLVYRVDEDGNGLGDAVVSGIKSLAFYAPFDVQVDSKGEKESISGEKLPGGKTSLAFIKAVEADSHGELPLPGLPKPEAAGDHFKQVTPGTEVRFKIRAFNDFLKQTPEPQMFRASLKVTADQCEGLELDKRNVIFIVPPKPIVVG